MRQDAPGLASHAIDYLILDEAQAIKNARSATAKAARLLQARHRLAMSGTPVENHLGELWSLFEFLNPGMLGSATAFGRATSASASTDTDASAALELVAGAVRPFVLRRTKQQVASELPAKTEQLLHCEMAPAQKRLYDDVLAESRKSVLELVDHEGVAKASLFVLEALLRLRQAACHPGLIDPARTGEESGKLEMLLERLREIAAEGQQALVFSQFTKLLDIVQSRLTDERIRFERLDGKTRDRQARVERFQAGSAPVFLVSLKAGGVGLNLTAAGYVFLLDPWWNPAVEAQAVDRTHRIGQTKPVFAYRLVAPGTIEEKVMQLQERKRAIADAVIRADAGLVRGLTREELEHLLS
jgi:SNF2 family DNA or RNA helicase